jgi:glycosyltransferase involved in cell wall biosynthesis
LLAQRLLEICNLSPVERQAHGAAGREHAARFTWEKAAAATTQALRRALRLES